MLTGSDDGTAKIWDVQTVHEIGTIISLTDGNWVVADGDGRFDTNLLEGELPVSWIFAGDPLRPLPLEIFMRDYYEPGLLPRLLAGEKFKPIHPGSLNRVQAVGRGGKHRVAGCGKWHRSGDGKSEPGNKDQFPRDGRMVEVSTSVYDLRIFRDGQLVEPIPELDLTRRMKSFTFCRVKNRVGEGCLWSSTLLSHFRFR